MDWNCRTVPLSEHATREEAQDAFDTWTAEREYEDWVGQAHSGHKGGEMDPERLARDYAAGDRIVDRLMKKSLTVRGKGPVRKALFGEQLAMTPEEIHMLRSPVEIMLRYTPKGNSRVPGGAIITRTMDRRT